MASRGELRRLIEGGGVEMDGERLGAADRHIVLEGGKPLRLKLGRRRFFRVFLAEVPCGSSSGPSGFGC